MRPLDYGSQFGAIQQARIVTEGHVSVIGRTGTREPVRFIGLRGRSAAETVRLIAPAFISSAAEFANPGSSTSVGWLRTSGKVRSSRAVLNVHGGNREAPASGVRRTRPIRQKWSSSNTARMKDDSGARPRSPLAPCRMGEGLQSKQDRGAAVNQHQDHRDLPREHQDQAEDREWHRVGAVRSPVGPRTELEPARLASVRCDEALRGNGHRHGLDVRAPSLSQPPELQRLNQLLEFPIF